MAPDENDELSGFDSDDAGFSGSFLFAVSDAERRPIKELYRVFARPRNDRDRRGGDLAARWGALDMGADVDDEMDRPPGLSEDEWRAVLPGEVLEDEGRVLLEGLGGDEDMVYAAPTANDHICHALLPNGGGGCGAPGPDGLDLNLAYPGSGSLVVYGLVGDEITSVDVIVGGETRAARMGENAFGIRVVAKPSELEAVVLHRRDGTTNPILLGLREEDERPDDE